MASHPPLAPPAEEIEVMFDGIVARYDLLNSLLSLGLDKRWRRAALEALPLRAGDVVLDVGCGTGELSRLLARRVTTIGVDLSEQMLRVSRRRLNGQVHLVRGSAFELPFRAGAFQALASGFVLRNLRDLPGAFREMARVLAPGAQIALLDAIEPSNPLIRRTFDAYFGLAAPALGSLVGKGRAYRYLVQSLAHLPSPADLRDMLLAAGFARAAARPLHFGAVVLLTAQKDDRR
ncbi:MAG: ubiquinone/menaquinone biosynthesis methyltransferase [Chloroflexota bacterium]